MFSKSAYEGLERRVFRPSLVFIALSVLAVAGIVFATLCPIGMRPHVASAGVERFGAYFILGAVLAFTLRRRPILVLGFVVLLAVALEAGQLLIPTRDARVFDAAVKALGGFGGACVVYLSFPLGRLLARLMVKAAPSESAGDRAV